MLILLSPAKNLNFDPVPDLPAPTRPRLLEDTGQLLEVARTLSAGDIARLMDLSPRLAELNRARFEVLDPMAAGEGTREAALAFNGDVYRGLDARSLDAEAMAFAQTHLRILSGLYGLLRPLDAIMPYRLEMGTRLKTGRGTNLYDFWGSRIAGLVAADLEGQASRTVVNLASGEYAGALDRAALDAPVIDIQFREEQDGDSRVISFHAKYARGLMARFAIDNRIVEPEALKAFDRAGYRYNATLSTPEQWVFSRPQPPLKKPAKSAARKAVQS